MNIIEIITPIYSILIEIKNYTVWIIISPLISFLAFHLDGAFIGANKTKIMRNTVIISFSIYIICLIIFVPIFSNHGLWASFIIFMLLRGLLLLSEYKKLYQFN